MVERAAVSGEGRRAMKRLVVVGNGMAGMACLEQILKYEPRFAVTVFGEPMWGNPNIYRRIGFCPEQDAFYERMTGLEWVSALVRLPTIRPPSNSKSVGIELIRYSSFRSGVSSTFACITFTLPK